MIIGGEWSISEEVFFMFIVMIGLFKYVGYMLKDFSFMEFVILKDVLRV